MREGEAYLCRLGHGFAEYFDFEVALGGMELCDGKQVGNLWEVMCIYGMV